MSLRKHEAAKAHAGAQEPGPDAAVGADSMRHFGDVGARALAQGRDGVDGRDTLRQKGVGGQFGQLSRPEVGGNDALARHPALIDRHDLLDGRSARGRALAADQHAVGVLQVVNGRALCQKLGIRDDIKVHASPRLRVKNALHRFSCSHRQRALFHDDLGRARMLQNLARCPLPVLQVGGSSGALAERLGGRVHAHKDDIGRGNLRLGVGAEKEVAATCLRDHLIEPRLIDRQPRRVPGGNALGVGIDHDHTVLWAVLGDHRHGRPADIACSDT